MKILSIAICTYDRLELLPECLASIDSQYTAELHIIVVNNHPDQQKAVVNICSKYPHIHLYHQPNVGLSHARNKAIKECPTAYIGFMDDDARLGNDYVTEALAIAKEQRMDCYGGHISSWWFYGRPDWLSEEWGSKPRLYQREAVLKNDEYLWASNLIIRKSLLSQIGGFPTEIGMIGKRLGYGVENQVQIKLRQLQVDIHYIPSLVVEHIIVKEKLNLLWQLKSIRSTVRDSRNIFPDQFTWSANIFKLLRFPRVVLLGFWKVVFTKNYYWQNWILDSWRSIAM